MGFGGISVWQLLIVLLIVVMIFGTKRLRGLGADVGGALKGFRKAVSDADSELNPQLHDDTKTGEAATDRVRETSDT